ncbi:MAG: MFS transporter [Candidatus Kapabacteria bacterium]|nr:MFS transporter [Ignavibacteriota bacterium]MCW5883652.1 MFS transporter [Candidatus Kapabacteria bacterium]
MKLISSIKSLPGKYWLLQFIQMLERLSYAALVLQMAVYISQKDLVGGLHFEHTEKGLIFLVWALVQNLTPVLTGGFADKFGRKRMLVIAIIIAVFGFFLAAFQREFYSFLFSVLIIGFGLGLYRPALYGMIADKVSSGNSSVAWGMNVMLINVAVFFAPPLAKYLESFSWQILFIGLGVILLFSIIPVLFIQDNNRNESNNSMIIKDTFRSLIEGKVIFIVLILSGFMIIYMQFYETLPNFIYDWIDTSDIALAMNLPESMTMQTSLGKMIEFKWLYNLNSGLIIIGVVFVNWMLSGFRITTSLIIGVIIAAVGLTFSGWSQYGIAAIIGMLIYTTGEMITNPNFSRYMSEIAPKEKKSTYMGFISLSLAIGLGGGSILGGYLYQNYAEKSSLAIDYINNNFKYNSELDHSNALMTLMNLTNTSAKGATELLWNEYSPQYIWLVFLVIGIISALLLYLFSRKYKLS